MNTYHAALWSTSLCNDDRYSINTLNNYKDTGAFLTQLLERKETAQVFDQLHSLINGCNRRSELKKDQQHCSYSTLLTKLTK